MHSKARANRIGGERERERERERRDMRNINIRVLEREKLEN